MSNNNSSVTVWLNGEFVPENSAKVSLLDRGYLYGDGLFETMRAYSGKIFRWQQHLSRLLAAAQELGINVLLDSLQLNEIAAELLQKNNLSDAYLRLTLSRGPHLGTLPPFDIKPTISLIARPLHLPSAEEYEKGWSAIAAKTSLAPDSRLSRLKTICYLDKLLAKQQAQRLAANEALLINSNGEITEASTSNVFIVKDSKLITPPVSSGLLPGITRDAVLSAAAGLSLQPAEERILPEDINTAQEAFLTNSIIELMPLTVFNEKPVGGGQPGQVTASLTKAYRALITRELMI